MLPLAGKRILITRARRQASSLAEQLEALGAKSIVIPAIEIVPPDSYAVLDQALLELGSFDWVVFTSANAVEVFAARCRKPQAAPKMIAVIGPSTAKAAESLGLQVSLVPPQFVAESLAETLVPRAAGKRILLIRAEDARDVLPQALERAGAKVTIAPAYRNRVPKSSIPAMRELFGEARNYPDAITLTSASTVHSLLTLLDESGLSLPDNIPLASIGPITSEAARKAGYDPAIEAKEATIVSLAQSLATYFSKQNPG